MGRKSNHHYIPKCYLKGFTEKGENSSIFWCVPIRDGVPFKTSPNNSCAQRDYYTIDHPNPLAVEDFYADEVETRVGRAIAYINKNSSLPPKTEMADLILLLSTLFVRAPAFRETLEASMQRVREIAASINDSVLVSNINEFEFDKAEVIKSELNLIDEVQESLAKKYYQLYIVEDLGMDFITSDNPFVLSHPDCVEGFNFALNTSNVEICVPITKKAVVIAKNEPIVEKTIVADARVVGLVNYKIINSASKYFYSSSESFVVLDEELNTINKKIVTRF